MLTQTLEDLRANTTLNAKGCWEWQGYRVSHGYGGVRHAGSYWLVHRLVYLLVYGELTEPCVMHTCDNPICCNPKHLQLGTNKDNSEDMVSKGRVNRGEDRPQAKLTEEVVRDIRTRCYESATVSDLAREHSVSRRLIRMVAKGERWTHVS